MDKIRVFRILEYYGNRDVVEKHLKQCLKGVKIIKDYQITAQTITEFPEIVKEKDNAPTRS